MSRYDELVSLILDGEPTQGELAELEQLLREEPKLTRDLAEQLANWEIWAQDAAPERSPEAFLAGFLTRSKAEADSADFRRDAIQKLKSSNRPTFLIPQLIAAGIALLACIFFFKRSDPKPRSTHAPVDVPSQSFTVKGEGVCTQCTLNQEGPHNKALRYTGADGALKLLLLKRDPSLRQHTQAFCGGPTPITAEGELVQINGEERFATLSLVFQEALP